jgi:predicted secreted protein
MAVQTEPIPGVKILVKADGTIIGGQDDATLNLNINSNEVNTKTNYGWQEMLQALVGWSVDVSGIYFEGSETPTATEGFGASLGLRDVGGTSYSTTPALSSLTITLNLETYERDNQDHGGYVVNAPDLRNATVSADIDYTDPNASNAAAVKKVLEAALENRNDLEFRASFGDEGSTFTGTAMPVPGSISASAGNDAEFSFDLESQGAITNNVANADPGLTALLDAFFANPVTKLSAQMGVIMDGTDSFTADYTKFTGDVWPGSIEITIPASGEITTSMNLPSASDLSMETVPSA